MSIALFLVLAILAAAAILQPLLPGSRAGYPLPTARERRAPRRSASAGQGTACPTCGAAAKPGDAFCVRCGGSLARASRGVCASCGAPIAEDDLFCRKCGTQVGGGEARQ